jgi:starch phosphorylase
VLNFSVLDGWWYEGYREGAGWALTDKRTYDNQQYQDQLDAATIYHILEDEIIPLYYARNSDGFSPGWVQYIKNSMSEIAPDYTMKRMLDDYIHRFYNKLAGRSALLKDNRFAKAREIAAWKQEVAEHWDSFQVESVSTDGDLVNAVSMMGREHTVSIVIDRRELRGTLGADLVVTKDNQETNSLDLLAVHPFELKQTEGSKLYFELKWCASEAGVRKIGIRVYPVNEELPHRMDFAYVRWIPLG